MKTLDLDQNEILLLKKLVELHIAQLNLYTPEKRDEETVEVIGKHAMSAINRSTTTKLLSKIESSINNQKN